MQINEWNEKCVSRKIRNLNDFTFYVLMRKVANIIFSYVTTNVDDSNCGKPWMSDRRNDEVNLFGKQTADGLYLEFFYGKPSSLWTPWGKWCCCGSSFGSWDNILPSLLERFGVTLYQPLRDAIVGKIGPVYALHRIDNVLLPNPVELEPAAYDFCKKARMEWEKLTKQYNNESV